MERQPRRRQPARSAAATATTSTPRTAEPKTASNVPPAIAGIGFVERSAQPQGFNTVGAIDGLIGSAVLGWAYDREFGRRRVRITLFVDDRLVAETSANGLRRELAGVNGHDGFSGFLCPIPSDRFTPGATVRVFGDGTELTQNPAGSWSGADRRYFRAD
jgi:hypothetical protein